MANQKESYLITAALPYANGPIHIGHPAGAYLPADIYARYLRNRGHDVLFVCGSDEGGVAITLQARKEGITPQTLVDRYHKQNQLSLAKLGISFDIFSRTSTSQHREIAQKFFLTLYEKGAFIEKESDEYYDEKEQIFLADRYLEGTCPHCKYTKAYGDQCESCGTSLSPQDLIQPRSRISGATLIKKKAKHWYLPLDRYQDWLTKWLKERGEKWRPNVYGQCLSWLQQGLLPRAMTRDLDWGVPVPLPNADGKVLYVWFEAPIGYITATQEWATTHNKTAQDVWQDDKRKLIHFIGKDNIVFHAIIFPVMLHTHGQYILPTEVVANEFMNLEGDKISTSRNHAIWLDDYFRDHPNQVDLLRYVLCANAPETKDSNFTWQDWKNRNNNELVAILGNFVHRTLTLLHKYYQGQVPTPNPLEAIDQETIQQIPKIKAKLESALDSKKFRKALEHFMELPRLGNKYLADTTPWHADASRKATILYICTQIIAHITIFATPFLPCTVEKLLHMLQTPSFTWDQSNTFQLLSSGHQTGPSELLFRRIE